MLCNTCNRVCSYKCAFICLRKLFQSRSDRNLASLNGLRVLAMFGIIMGNTVLLMFQGITLNNWSVMLNNIKTFRFQFVVSGRVMEFFCPSPNSFAFYLFGSFLLVGYFFLL